MVKRPERRTHFVPDLTPTPFSAHRIPAVLSGRRIQLSLLGLLAWVSRRSSFPRPPPLHLRGQVLVRWHSRGLSSWARKYRSLKATGGTLSGGHLVCSMTPFVSSQRIIPGCLPVRQTREFECSTQMSFLGTGHDWQPARCVQQIDVSVMRRLLEPHLGVLGFRRGTWLLITRCQSLASFGRLFV